MVEKKLYCTNICEQRDHSSSLYQGPMNLQWLWSRGNLPNMKITLKWSLVIRLPLTCKISVLV